MSTAHASTIAKPSPFCDSREGMKKLEDALSSDDMMHAPLHEVERMIEAQGREVMRALMQAHFDLRSAQERSVEIRDVNGIEHGDVRRGSRKVETKFGEVEFERMVYHAPGTDGLAPLDAAMELPDEKYSYEVRRIVAEEAPRASFDEVVELIRKQSGADVPKRQVVRAHTSVTLHRQRRAQPAAATSTAAEACQVIVFAPVEPRHERAAPIGIWLANCDQLRRNTASTGSGGNSCPDDFRDTVAEISETMATCVPPSSDKEFRSMIRSSDDSESPRPPGL